MGMAQTSEPLPLDATVTATEVSRKVGQVMTQALQGTVGIARHRQVDVVMMSVDRYRQLLAQAGSGRRAVMVADIPDDEWASIEASMLDEDA